MALLAALSAGCVAAPSEPAPDDGWSTVYLRFEPALEAPGRLLVRHEAGVNVNLITGRAGVELRLPPGPAAVRLAAGGGVIERPMLVRGDAEIAWDTTEVTR